MDERAKLVAAAGILAFSLFYGIQFRTESVKAGIDKVNLDVQRQNGEMTSVTVITLQKTATVNKRFLTYQGNSNNIKALHIIYLKFMDDVPIDESKISFYGKSYGWNLNEYEVECKSDKIEFGKRII